MAVDHRTDATAVARPRVLAGPVPAAGRGPATSSHRPQPIRRGRVAVGGRRRGGVVAPGSGAARPRRARPSRHGRRPVPPVARACRSTRNRETTTAGLRSLVGRAFSPRQVDRVRHELRDHIDGLLDGMAGRVVDVHDELGHEVPLFSICAFLGIPVEDRERIDAFMVGTEEGFSYPMTPEKQARADAGIVALYDYSAELVDRRRQSSGDDLVSALVVAEVEGDRLTHDELLAMIVNLIGGAVGSSDAGIANMVHLMATEPAEADLVRRDPALVARVRRGGAALPAAVPLDPAQGPRARRGRRRAPRHRRHGVAEPAGREPRPRAVRRSRPVRGRPPAGASSELRLRTALLPRAGACPSQPQRDGGRPVGPLGRRRRDRRAGAHVPFDPAERFV